MIKRQEDPRRHKNCELCGKTGGELRMLVAEDFIGWACGECRQQLQECQVRRYMPAGEQTEPGE